VRAFQTANRRRPGLRPFIAGAMLLLAAAGWAQNAVIPDVRDPALYRDPARTGNCRVCGEISSIREVRVDPSIPGALDPGRNPVDHRLRMRTLLRPSDGFGWGQKGETFD